MKVTVNIATQDERADTLANTMLSLLGQCDEIRVYNNDQLTDYGALSKFYWLSKDDEPQYYLTCDDDLIYPPDYVEKTVKMIEDYECIISWHGRILKDREKYYGADHFGLRFWQASNQPYFLDTGGTGVMGFRTDYFKPMVFDRPEKHCADLTIGLEAIKQGKKICSPPKKMDWITEQQVKSSIFKTYRNSEQTEQIRLMKELLKCKNG